MHESLVDDMFQSLLYWISHFGEKPPNVPTIRTAVSILVVLD